MKVRKVNPKDLERVKPVVIQFMKRYGEGRITGHAIRWFRALQPHQLNEHTLIMATLDGKVITGVIIFGNYGLDESFIAVHPRYRNQGVGGKLLELSLEKLPKVYTRVACDNAPSLKLCFSCGLTAFDLFKGVTGKPTLWLGGGDWSKNEVLAAKEPISH